MKLYILLTVHHAMILGKWPTWPTYSFYVFIFIYNSLHVSSTSCSSSGETNCINTTSGNCHSVLVAVSCAGWEFTPNLHRSICSCSKAVYKPVRHTPLLSVQWINSWWWTEELSETYRVSCQNKFVNFVHLIGFITKKFVTVHGHTNVKFVNVKQAKEIYQCRNTKEKLYKTNAEFHPGPARKLSTKLYGIYHCWV